MRTTQSIALSIILLLAFSFFLNSAPKEANAQTTPDVYVGVDVAYGDIPAIKNLIDEVSAYTNIFVIGCSGITYDVEKLNDMCQYLYDRNMFFLVFTVNPQQPPQEWFATARNNWGSSFLGLYVDDEIGGKQLDQARGLAWVNKYDNVSSFLEAEQLFEKRVSGYLNLYVNHSDSTPMFTSDYALYWFDYKAGYDTIFAEFGWNYSQQLNVALCRGAATMQNKDWGVILTFTYTTPPYLESGEKLYKDMVLAYENGAKYILVFDTDEYYTHDILTQEHLDALKMFWQYTQQHPRTISPPSERVAYVLPESYAYGFRGPNDKIWGLWQGDNFSRLLSIGSDIVLDMHGTRLDFVYENGLQPGNTHGYGNIVYWNDPAQVEPNWPQDEPVFPLPTKNPFPTPTPGISAIPTATPTLSSTPAVSSTEDPTPKPSITQGEKLASSDLYIYEIIIGFTLITAASVAVATVFVFRSYRQRKSKS